jgi:hypothetical protein
VPPNALAVAPALFTTALFPDDDNARRGLQLSAATSFADVMWNMEFTTFGSSSASAKGDRFFNHYLDPDKKSDGKQITLKNTIFVLTDVAITYRTSATKSTEDDLVLKPFGDSMCGYFVHKTNVGNKLNYNTLGILSRRTDGKYSTNYFQSVFSVTSTAFLESSGRRLPPDWIKATIHHSFLPTNFGSQFDFEHEHFEERTGSDAEWPCLAKLILGNQDFEGLKLERFRARALLKDRKKFQSQKQDFYRKKHLTLVDFPVPETTKNPVNEDKQRSKIVFDMIAAAAESSKIASAKVASHQGFPGISKSDKDFWQPLFLFFGIGIDGYITTDKYGKLFGTVTGVIDKECYTMFPTPDTSLLSTDTRPLMMPNDARNRQARQSTLVQALEEIKNQYDILVTYLDLEYLDVATRDPDFKYTIRLFRQEFGVVSPQNKLDIKLVGLNTGDNQIANLRIAFDTKKDYQKNKRGQYSEFMEVAHTIIHETTHYMNDGIGDFNYFFFKAGNGGGSKAMSRAKMGDLTQTKDFGSSKNVRKLFSRGDRWSTSKDYRASGMINPTSSAYGILGTGCKRVQKYPQGIELKSTTQFFTVNADSYASFALVLNKSKKS